VEAITCSAPPVRREIRKTPPLKKEQCLAERPVRVLPYFKLGLARRLLSRVHLSSGGSQYEIKAERDLVVWLKSQGGEFSEKEGLLLLGI